MILYYIYETDVVWEYLNKISDMLNFSNKCQKIFYEVLLVKAYDSGVNKNYILFINNTYNTFITRLISCPICFNFWICLVFSVFLNINNLFIYAFFSLIFYFFIKILTNLSHKI